MICRLYLNFVLGGGLEPRSSGMLVKLSPTELTRQPHLSSLKKERRREKSAILYR